MSEPIGWLRILGRNVWFSQSEPVGKPGIHVPVAVFKPKTPALSKELLDAMREKMRDEHNSGLDG